MVSILYSNAFPPRLGKGASGARALAFRGKTGSRRGVGARVRRHSL